MKPFNLQKYLKKYCDDCSLGVAKGDSDNDICYSCVEAMRQLSEACDKYYIKKIQKLAKKKQGTK